MSVTYRYRKPLDEIKQYIRERDSYQCVLCGVDRNLQVHHIKPHRGKKKLLLKARNCVLLCSGCHVNCAHAGDLSGLEICPVYSRLLTKYVAWVRAKRRKAKREARIDAVDNEIRYQAKLRLVS